MFLQQFARTDLVDVVVLLYICFMETMVTVDPKEALRFLQEKAQRRKKLLDERFAEASHDAQRIITMIVEEYSPLRIWQWGSLLRRQNFSEISDIDIAVEGITNTETFFELYGKALAMTRFPLDLIQIEKIESLYAESIRT